MTFGYITVSGELKNGDPLELEFFVFNKEPISCMELVKREIDLTNVKPETLTWKADVTKSEKSQVLQFRGNVIAIHKK